MHTSNGPAASSHTHLFLLYITPHHQVTAVAYDNPIPGFKTRNCINLRLWAAKPSREFDLEAFNTGDYVQVGVELWVSVEWCPVRREAERWSWRWAAAVD
jgi:glucan phosphorylase